MIGIIGAMAVEVEGLKTIMENARTEHVSSVDFCLGRIHDTDVVAAEAGVGKVNAAVTAQTMILKYRPTHIINIGVAGGLDERLAVGDEVVADKVAEHDMDTTALGDEPGYITGLNTVFINCDAALADLLYDCAKELGINTIRGVVVSGDQFISTDTERNRLIRQFCGTAAEMEGAAIGHVCAMNGTPFGVLRSISDGANNDSAVDFPSFCRLAANRSIEIIKLLLKKIGENA